MKAQHNVKEVGDKHTTGQCIQWGCDTEIQAVL